MYNYSSSVVQQPSMYNIFDNTGLPPSNGYMQPQYNPNMDYFRNAAPQLNIQPTEYRPVYNNPFVPTNGYGQPQLNTYYQQPRQPWQLMQPSFSTPQYGDSRNPFVSTPGYGPYSPYNNYQFQQQSSYVIPGFNPTGNTEMYSEDMKLRLKALDDKYQKLNTEKMIERRRQYSGFGYNYYGMMNSNYIDPILNSEYNREKAAIEAEAKEKLMDFNMKLSKAVHYYLGDKDLNDEDQLAEMKKVYSNTVVNIPQKDMNNYYLCRSLERGVDITDAARASAQAADRKVSEYYHKIVNPKADIDEFLDTAGLILWEASVEEMNKKGATYNERYSYDKLQKELQRNIDIRDGFVPSYKDLDPDAPFRAMSQLGILEPTPGINMDFDSGTISLNRNEWLNNKRQIEHNREQMNYEAQRKAFIDSIYNPMV